MQRRVAQRTNGNHEALDQLLHPKRSRIKWTQDEERGIAHSLADQIISKPFRRNFLKAIKVAQEQLTKEGTLDATRHRTIQSPANIPGIIDQTRDILTRYREQTKQVDHAQQILKTQHQNHTSREQVLDSLTDEEIEAFFRDNVMHYRIVDLEALTS